MECTPHMGEDDVVTIDNRVYTTNDLFAEIAEPEFARLNFSGRKDRK